MGAMMVGQISAFTPDYMKAKVAAARLFKIFDRIPVIQSDSIDGLSVVSFWLIVLYNFTTSDS